jgi:shikimate kinase
MKSRKKLTYLISLQENIILMGSPGSGKTTVGRILGKNLGMPVIDIDDHHLEPYWGMSVANKVKQD